VQHRVDDRTLSCPSHERERPRYGHVVNICSAWPEDQW
jgi:hypothetical protein